MKASSSLGALLVAGLLFGLPAKAQELDRVPIKLVNVPEQVASAYRWADFETLEKLYVACSQPEARSPLAGSSRLTHFWMGIERVHSSNLNVSDLYYHQVEALTGKWARESPKSMLAQLLHARALLGHAWVYRGSGFSNTVSPTAWKLFEKQLELADAQLRRAEPSSTNDSSWNLIALELGLLLGKDRRLLMQIYEAGFAKNPSNESLHFAMLGALLPKWGGDLESAERFINLVTKNTRDRLGMEMYARLYAELSDQEVKQGLFKSTRADWPTMKQGFEDRLKRFPHQDNRSPLAYFACMAGDRATLREQFELLGDSPSLFGWGSDSQRKYETCKVLAQEI